MVVIIVAVHHRSHVVVVIGIKGIIPPNVGHWTLSSIRWDVIKTEHVLSSILSIPMRDNKLENDSCLSD